MLLKQQMKNKPFEVAKIKEEQQTDGSCHKQSDLTGSDSGDELKKKMKCRKNLEGEFFVYTYVNNEKKMLKLVEVTDSDTDKTSQKETESSDSDVPQKKGEGSGDSCLLLMKSEESAVETDKSEESVQELAVNKAKPVEIVINSDNEINSSSSTNTADIYAEHMDPNKSKISLPTSSTLSMSLLTTDGYDMDNDKPTDSTGHATDVLRKNSELIQIATVLTGNATTIKNLTDLRDMPQKDFCLVTYTDDSEEGNGNGKDSVQKKIGDTPTGSETEGASEGSEHQVSENPSVPENLSVPEKKEDQPVEQKETEKKNNEQVEDPKTEAKSDLAVPEKKEDQPVEQKETEKKNNEHVEDPNTEVQAKSDSADTENKAVEQVEDPKTEANPDLTVPEKKEDQPVEQKENDSNRNQNIAEPEKNETELVVQPVESEKHNMETDAGTGPENKEKAEDGDETAQLKNEEGTKVETDGEHDADSTNSTNSEKETDTSTESCESKPSTAQDKCSEYNAVFGQQSDIEKPFEIT